MQKTRVQYLGQEDPVEEEMATHSIILTWKIPWTEEAGVHSVVHVAKVHRVAEFDTAECLSLSTQKQRYALQVLKCNEIMLGINIDIQKDRFSF